MSEVVSWLDTIGRVFEGIPDLATPEQVESALSEILDDPGLTLYWWDWELERYVDVRGVTAEPAAGAGGAVTWVGYETRKIGALAHDARLLDVPEFTATLIPLMRIAMTFSRPASVGAYRTKVTRVAASNRVWDRVTPPNAFTKKPRRAP